jgi:tRNA(Ile)-lysidine synthase
MVPSARKSSAFCPAQLLLQLRTLPQPECYLVAYSGGVDSHVLLHAMAEIQGQCSIPVRAIHVQHGLHPAAADWAVHCQSVCQTLNIPLQVVALQLQLQPGASLEAVAREARYTACWQQALPKSMLLTAHHADDQAETVLLQLLRGAGVEGLAAMPVCRTLSSGWHGRPCLSWTRQALRQYAQQHALVWIDDPSNQNTEFDRNYLRQQVMPLLQARWPAASRTLTRSAGHIAAVLPLVQAQTEQDLAVCMNSVGRLQIAPLQRLSTVRCQQVLRAWIRQAGHPVPNQAHLSEIKDRFLKAIADRQPEVAWQNTRLRRYRGELWLLRRPVPSPPTADQLFVWPADQMMLKLPAGCGTLRCIPAAQGIPARYWQEYRISVRWRCPGMRCRPAGRQGSRSFKKLCQAYGIPPWQRPYVPLVYRSDQLIAVADVCLCIQPFTGEACYQLQWFADDSKSE